MRSGPCPRIAARTADAAAVGATEINLPWGDTTEPEANPSERTVAQAIPD